jgi:hypothetical protein
MSRLPAPSRNVPDRANLILFTVRRRLGVETPEFPVPRRQTSSPVAEHSVATIRGILAAPTLSAQPIAAAR